MHFALDEVDEDRHARTMLNNKSAATAEPVRLRNHFAEISVVGFFI